MFVSGIILAPAVIAATPAAQDLADLRTVINTAASTIGDPNNPNLGWGFGNKGEFGTADLVNNITTTLLRIKFEIDTNMTAWLTPSNMTTNLTTPSPPAQTLPLTASMVIPSTAPTSTPTGKIDLSTPYIDYVAAIPNLSTALMSLGRAYHREMNTPVSTAIEGFQQSMTTFQSAFLSTDMIDAQCVLRTLRASSSLENAKNAWGRLLNLPGRGTGAGADSGSDEMATGPTGGLKKRGINQSGNAGLARSVPSTGRYFTHQELWGRGASKTKRSDASGQTKNRMVVSAENARVGVGFVV